MSTELIVEELDIVQRYRESHHRVAQMLAMGCTPMFIRAQTGRSLRSIDILSVDPTFRELIRLYARQTDEKFAVAGDTYADLAIANMLRTETMIGDALDEAQETGDKVSLLTLDRISQGRADRFGYGKHQTVKHEHDFAAMLDKAIARSGKQDEVKMIEATATEVLPRTSVPLPEAPASARTSSSSEPQPMPQAEGLKPSQAIDGLPSVVEGRAPIRTKERTPPPRPSFAAVLVKRRKVA